MNEEQCNINTFWKSVYRIAELTSLITLSFLYVKGIRTILKNRNKFEFVDIIIVILSFFQINIFIILIIFGLEYFLILFIEILKFSENALIGYCVLFQLMLKINFDNAYSVIKKYIVIIILIDLASLLGGLIYEYEVIDTKEILSTKFYSTFILAGMGLILDLIILGMACVRKFNKSFITPSVQENLTNEGYRLHSIIKKYENRIAIMKRLYMGIIVSYAFSYSFNIFSKIFYDESICFSNNGESYGPMDFLVMYIFLLILRIIPHSLIYLAIMWYKPDMSNQNASFIQII